MPEQIIPRAYEVRVPEPGLTPETIVDRARALIPAIREQQDEAEKLGRHTAELDEKFTEAGFYRIVQPKRFGRIRLRLGDLLEGHDGRGGG